MARTRRETQARSKPKFRNKHACHIRKQWKRINFVASRHSDRGETGKLKTNVIGIVGAVIALIGLVLPWWTMTLSMTVGMNLSYSASIYLYQTTASGIGTSVTGQMNLWYGWVAFALLVLGALFGIAGSLIKARVMLVLGGVLALLSIIVFAAGLQNDLSSSSSLSSVGLFSSGSFFGSSYTTYLSFGFWLALIGAIVVLAASLKKPKVTAPIFTPPPPAREKASTPPS